MSAYIAMRRAPRRLGRFVTGSPSLTIGLIILAVLLVLAAGAPWLAPFDPLDMISMPLTWPGADRAFLFGTDMMGRDIFSGIVWGARVSLELGFATGVLAAGLGIAVGAISGFYGGHVDDVLMRVAEFFQSMPSLLFTIVMVVIFGPTVTTIVLSIAVTSWPQVARLVRSEALRVSRLEFVQAAIVTGLSKPQIIATHILPNVISPAIVMISILAGNAILTEAVVAFLGLGDPNIMTWGSMIGAGRVALQTAWYITAIPGIAVLITVLALNLIGNGLNDLDNPHVGGVL